MAAILLIEPDVRLAELYADRLRHDGHSVEVAHGAQPAVLAADANRPDIVVLEPQLTNHSGIEFLYEFRSYDDWRDVPVVLISHVPGDVWHRSHRALRHRLGVRDYLYKPGLSLAELSETVARLV